MRNPMSDELRKRVQSDGTGEAGKDREGEEDDREAENY